MTGRIEELDEQIKNLRREITELEGERHALREDAAGVHKGDVVVVVQRNREPFDVLVDRVDTRWDPPWIRGFKRKKDGTWGSQSHAYDSDWKVA